ncbi:MAG: type II toxin-antitoxin system RelE/ParE family toxin [Aromatoleum sp.]|jgi:plasmid stabilization system protein ParE|uniref:type II toxin-antitoxin system RelE/ParE family toxin n=1 Tax=Aromatoleum sp. TaxID=2307007 RepID=UPI0028961902|nr:type II toxin-antitoxin system RelE/ParE family toxin [Aromatoleum sp.]MDT3672440.1 type II toxin-antitoxin system RelE/ParE family toxin [Aromatoleum sp.]
MRIVWTRAALDDLEEILAYYFREAGPATAEAVSRRLISQIESLAPFPERIRESDRIPGARELVIRRLPYIAFVKISADAIVILNLVHTARKFPGEALP